MTLAEIDQAVTQPQPGTRMPARFSIAQFDAMIDAGVFSAESDRQIQLLNGEIVMMTPPNPLHDDVVGLPVVPLTRIFIDLPCIDSVIKTVPVDQCDLSLPDVAASKVIDLVVL